MSEYQYYEFAAVDRPLNLEQQAELRSRSTRATITATRFVNEYHWGDLKGDPADWVQRYFDAHVYSANWQSCRLVLRLPRAALDKETLADFIAAPGHRSRSGFIDAFTAKATPEYWILDWNFNDDSSDYERFWSETDGPGWIGRLLPLREEMLRGDTRPLYLGWLARLCNDELDEDELEPSLPAGLRELTPAQTALAEFLLLDPDWLAAAAQDSAPLAGTAESTADYDAWLAMQEHSAMRATLRLLLEGRGQEAERGLRKRFLQWQREQRPETSDHPERRSVAQIATLCDAAREARLQRERAEKAALEAKRQAERRAHLTQLYNNANAAWDFVDQNLQRGTGVAYERALEKVKDLAAAYRQAKNEAEFQRCLLQLMETHGSRKAWVTRLLKAGFRWE